MEGYQYVYLACGKYNTIKEGMPIQFDCYSSLAKAVSSDISSVAGELTPSTWQTFNDLSTSLMQYSLLLQRFSTATVWIGCACGQLCTAPWQPDGGEGIPENIGSLQ